MALTKTQLRVLRVLADGGGPLHKMRGMLASCFLARTMETVRWPTVGVLQALGCIEDFSDPAMRWRSSTYRITPKGREYLAKVS